MNIIMMDFEQLPHVPHVGRLHALDHNRVEGTDRVHEHVPQVVLVLDLLVLGQHKLKPGFQ